MADVKVNDLGDAIKDILDAYGDVATKAIQESALKVGKQTVKDIKKASPILTGDYKKNWKYGYKKSYSGASATVYNEKEYYLTHLLENGHLNRDGSRTKAEPHIKEVNDKAQQNFINEIKSRLG